jgi:hypothetical protein
MSPAAIIVVALENVARAMKENKAQTAAMKYAVFCILP